MEGVLCNVPNGGKLIFKFIKSFICFLIISNLVEHVLCVEVDLSQEKVWTVNFKGVSLGGKTICLMSRVAFYLTQCLE